MIWFGKLDKWGNPTDAIADSRGNKSDRAQPLEISQVIIRLLNRNGYTLTTMTEIHDLNLTDTEYAALAAKGYDPQLEQLMIEVGEDPEEARKLTRLVGLTKDKPPETDKEWAEFMSIWGGQ